MRRGFVIYIAVYPLKAMVKLVCAYYYSIKEYGIANLLTYLDPLLFTPFLLEVLASTVGENGIWLALPISQAAVMLSFLIWILTGKKKQRRSQ